jgi:hypothetical protein
MNHYSLVFLLTRLPEVCDVMGIALRTIVLCRLGQARMPRKPFAVIAVLYLMASP